MDVNEDTDILDRLGILGSKLECPNKQFPSPKVKATATANMPSSSSVPIFEAAEADGWSGLSLDDESSNMSSNDSDCLFDRRDRNGATNGMVANGLGRPRLRRHHHRRISGAPNCWKLLALLSAAAFMGFSMNFSHRMPSFSAASPAAYHFSADELLSISALFRFVATHAISLWIGSIFASSALLRVNPFFVFLLLMLIFLCICLQIQMAEAVQDATTIGQSILLFLCAAQAFIAGAIERGILLVSPLWTSRLHRTLFLAYAAMAFSATGSFFLQHNIHNPSLSLPVVLPQSLPQISSFYAPIERVRRTITTDLSPTNGTNNAIPSFVSIENPQKSNGSPSAMMPNLPTNNGTNSTNLTAAASDSQEPVFKTKTEENAFRRKEAELKRKKEQQKEAEDEKKEQKPATNDTMITRTTMITTTTSTSTIATTTTTIMPAPATTTTIMTTVRRATHIPILTATTPSPINLGNSSSSSPPSARLFSAIQLAILSSFVVPILLGFCCCCALDHPICSTQYRHLAKLLSPPNSNSSVPSGEPLLCHLLSMSICAIHAALTALMELSMAHNGTSAPFGSFSLPSASIFWASLGFGRAIFAIRPSLATSSTSLHCLYFVSIISCAFLHFFLSSSSPLTILLGIAFSAFSSANIPLLLYTWQCASAHSSILIASGHFITAMAFGKLAGPTIFVWWIGGTEGQFPRQALSPSSVFFFGFGVLSVSYVLFWVLLAKLRRSQRQQQISQLSGALNGQAKRNGRGKAKTSGRRPKTKGPYKALMSSSTLGGGGEESNLSMAGLEMETSSGEEDEISSEEEEAIELEMESIGEEADRDGGERKPRINGEAEDERLVDDLV